MIFPSAFVFSLSTRRVQPSPFQGGIKVLVAGSWQTAGESGGCGGGNDGFVVLFDGVPVPTETVHPGLLKCHAPGESNLLTLNSNSRKWKKYSRFFS